MIRKIYLENQKVFLLLSIFLFIYMLFHFIFYILFVGLLVDGFIGFNIVLMFIYIYFYFGESINIYFLNISKNIWIYFYSLLVFVLNLKDLILEVNLNYLQLLYVKLVSLNSIHLELIKNFNENFYCYLKSFVYNFVCLKFLYVLKYNNIKQTIFVKKFLLKIFNIVNIKILNMKLMFLN